ncbi:TolC family protein [Pendulispora rubella]|uniref:TolC family protein n=1 Tax=Pendulispora rubella TaxID=2741070 RepID=A0ABZ2LIP9_9BACT
MPAVLLPLLFAQAVSAVPPPRILTLREALDTATTNQPLMRRARATTAVSKARVEQARSGYLPQLTGTASYQRRTGNSAPTPGGAAGAQSNISWTDTYNSFNFGLQATQLIYDFGQTNGKWHAADVNVEVSQASERTTRIATVVNVKSAYYLVRANKALIKVQEETLANLDRHVQQSQAFVQVGTRPEIDVVQSRTQYANGRVGLITAQNNYEIAKADLNQRMGVVADTNFEVGEEDVGPLQDEDMPVDALIRKAIAQRPELAGLAKQKEAQEISIRATKGAYGPTLNATAGLTAVGTELGSLGPNWSVGAALNWPILSGWQTHGAVHEAEASLNDIAAQVDQQQLQVSFDVQQAWLQVKANREAIDAAKEALTNAREQLRLAEGRYQAGTGNIIELNDAQVAATTAAAQVIQADYNLATARAQLLAAMGRS